MMGDQWMPGKNMEEGMVAKIRAKSRAFAKGVVQQAG